MKNDKKEPELIAKKKAELTARATIGQLLDELIKKSGFKKKSVADWLEIKPSQFTKYFSGKLATLTSAQAAKLLGHAVDLRMTPDEYRRIAEFRNLPADPQTCAQACSVTIFSPASTLILPLLIQILERRQRPGDGLIPFRLECGSINESSNNPFYRYSGFDVLDRAKKLAVSVGIAHDEWVRQRRSEFMPIARISGGFRPRLYIRYDRWKTWAETCLGRGKPLGTFCDFIIHATSNKQKLLLGFSNRTVADAVLQDLQKAMNIDDHVWRKWFQQDPNWGYDKILEIPMMDEKRRPDLIVTWSPAGFCLMYSKLYIEVSLEFYSELFNSFEFEPPNSFGDSWPHFSRQCHAFKQDIYAQLSNFETTATLFAAVDRALDPFVHEAQALVRNACELMGTGGWQYHLPLMVETMWAIVHQPTKVVSTELDGLPSPASYPEPDEKEKSKLQSYAEVLLSRFRPSVRYELEYTEALEKELRKHLNSR